LPKPKISDKQKQFQSLIRKHGTPLAIVSRSVLQGQLAKFRAALGRVEPFYAVKANPHPEILKVMAEAGASFDVASIPEMQAVLKAGASPDRIIFANTIKRAESIARSARLGVDLMTFDSEYELDKIAANAPGARVVVRIKVPNVGSVVELSLKFGCEPSDAMALMIKAHQLGLRPYGVSFHVGSQCLRAENYIDSLEMAAIIVRDSMLKQLPLEMVDIGGGFPIPHFAGEEDPFEETSAIIAGEIDRLFEPNLRIIAEPGRFLAGPSATLIMRVIGKAIRDNKHWYYLDDGVYGSLSGIIFDHAEYEYQVFNRGQTQLTTLAGPTCDGLDVITRSTQMPELDVGDIVYVENIGAYSTASTTWFNGLEPAKIVMLP
jgi:ornithine decarboxylase